MAFINWFSAAIHTISMDILEDNLVEACRSLSKYLNIFHHTSSQIVKDELRMHVLMTKVAHWCFDVSGSPLISISVRSGSEVWYFSKILENVTCAN
jgi:hypothetical protein